MMFGFFVWFLLHLNLQLSAEFRMLACFSLKVGSQSSWLPNYTGVVLKHWHLCQTKRKESRVSPFPVQRGPWQILTVTSASRSTTSLILVYSSLYASMHVLRIIYTTTPKLYYESYLLSRSIIRNRKVFVFQPVRSEQLWAITHI